MTNVVPFFNQDIIETVKKRRTKDLVGEFLNNNPMSEYERLLLADLLDAAADRNIILPLDRAYYAVTGEVANG